MRINTYTELELEGTMCAFDKSSSCEVYCTACVKVHSELQMENHSGSMLRMRETASKRGRCVTDILKRREGTEEILSLPDEYGCLRLMKGET